MWPPLRHLLSLVVTGLLSTVPVIACEGECIVGITNAFMGNYTHPIQSVFTDLANQVRVQILPRMDSPSPLSLLSPFLVAYRDSAYTSLETAIFPKYFHGKCQQPDPANPGGDLVDPPGCPNPDCPVVCGTPGSLVHFYSKLRLIAFTDTSQLMMRQMSNDSTAYLKVEEEVMKAAEAEAKRVGKNRDARYIAPRRNVKFYDAKTYMDSTGRLLNPRRSLDPKTKEEIRKQLRSILNQFLPKLKRTCGGTDTLSNCSWEKEMTEYILSFP